MFWILVIALLVIAVLYQNLGGEITWLLILGLLALFVLIKIISKITSRRCNCPNCKRFLRMKKTGSETIRKDDIMMLVEVKDRNSDREITGTREQYIPGSRITYRDTFWCKSCGNQKYKTYTKDIKKI